MYQLFNDDTMKIIKQLPDESIDLVVTDSPYLVTSRGSAGNSGGMLQKKINKQGKVFDNNSCDATVWMPEIFRVLKDGSHFYSMCNHVNLQHHLNTATSIGFHFIKSLIWDKGNKIMSQFYMSSYEYILFFRKGRGVKINNCGTADILSVPNKKMKDENGKNCHDTEKPVELNRILIENSSQPGDLVMDPFMGIGGCGVACVNTNRDFIGIEIDKKYFDIAEKRIKGEM